MYMFLLNVMFLGGDTAIDLGKQFKGLAQRDAKTLSWADFVAGAIRERELRQEA